MTEAAVVIDERFRGPKDSGNGGYTCGLVGLRTGNPAEVKLRRPPPLDRPLALRHDQDAVRLLDGDDVVAEGRPLDGLDLEVPDPVGFDEASASAEPFAEHPFPECFVCGPDRAPRDGLRVFAGPVHGRDGVFAASWVPDDTLAEPGSEHVAEVFEWAVLDCPTSAPVVPTLPPDRFVVLGTLVVERRERVRIGNRYVLMSWLESNRGKVRTGGAAVLDEHGTVLALGRGAWVLIDPARFASGVTEEAGGSDGAAG